jgi:UDP-N-acetylmuramate dehydrogenase
MAFGYRESVIKHSTAVIVTVTLQLHHGDVRAARALMSEHMAQKRSHQPLTVPSPGCMFKNYQLQEHDTALRQKFQSFVRGNQIPAWVFISQVGLSGKRIGDIQISDQHANFFINLSHGTAEQVIMLTSLVKQRVRDTYGVQLQEEVQFIGF